MALKSIKPDTISTTARLWVPRLLISAAAGMIAAIPMAMVMSGLNRLLPARKSSWLTRRLPLPPKQVTNRLSRRLGIPWITWQGRQWDWTTWLAHLGYGAAAASLFPIITQSLRGPAALRGMVFAFGVWAASYLGWLPAVKIMEPATRQPARRNVIMITSHLVWGSLIGPLVGFVTRRIDQPRKANIPGSESQ